jgi:hypothetical protein
MAPWLIQVQEQDRPTGELLLVDFDETLGRCHAKTQRLRAPAENNVSEDSDVDLDNIFD